MSRKNILSVRAEDLTFEEKVGQMLFARTSDVLEDPRYSRLVERGWFGGVQAHYPTFSLAKVSQVNEAALLPVFVGADAEEGCPLPPPKGTALPPAAAVAALNDPAVAEECGRMAARELMSEGINFLFGPVLDVNLQRAGPMSLRCYGSTVRQVAALGTATLRAYLAEGLVASAKHYPGGSSHSADDAHIVCSSEGQDLELAARWDLIPYRQAMKIGLNAIMTTHNTVREDGQVLPATFSKKAIEMIRRDGFDGLILTDSLAMGGLRSRWNNADCIYKAMAAGHDLILVDYGQDPAEAFDMMLHAARNGAASEEQITRSVARILREKRRLAQVRAPALSDEDLARHRRRARELSAQATTLRNRHPLDLSGRHLLLCMRSQRLDVNPEIGGAAAGEEFAAHLRRLLPKSEFVTVSEWPVREIEEVLRRASSHTSVVVVAETTWYAYRGTARYSEPFLVLVRALAHKIGAFVSLGEPNAVADLAPQTRNLIIPYAGSTAEQAVLDVLENPALAQGNFLVPDGRLDT